MTILGSGLDATDIPASSGEFARYGDRFTNRIFTEAGNRLLFGQAPARPPLRRPLRGEEAAMKALGTGLSRGVAWGDIEVVRGGGRPVSRSAAAHSGIFRGSAAVRRPHDHARRYAGSARWSF